MDLITRRDDERLNDHCMAANCDDEDCRKHGVAWGSLRAALRATEGK